MKFYTLVAGAVLFATTQISAQTPNSGLSYKEYVENMKQILRDNPGKSLDEITQMAQALRSNQLGLVPEAQLARGFRNLDLPATTREIHVLLADKGDITITTSPDANIHLNVLVLSSGSTAEVNALLGSVGMVSSLDGIAQLTSNANSYSCIRIKENGALSARGTCFQKVTIALPANSPVMVRDKNERLNHLDMPMSKEEFLAASENAMSSDRPRLINRFLSGNPGVRLSVAEAAQIEESVFASDVPKLFPLIAAHLPMNLSASDVEQLIEKPYSSDRGPLIKLLIPKVAPSERANLISVIEEKLFSSDRADVMRALVNGGN